MTWKRYLSPSPVTMTRLQLFQLLEPKGWAGVGRHAQVTARAHCRRAHLRSVGKTAALELLGKEALVKP